MSSEDKQTTTPATIDDLMEHEEELLANATARTMAAYNKSSTVANLRDWEAARKAVAEYRARKAAEENPAGRVFANLTEVLEYLKEGGWKIGKSKLYEDQGKIRREKDGSFTVKEVEKYAKLCLSRLDGSDVAPIDVTEKLRWDIEISKEKAKELRQRNEVESGRWVLRSDVEQMLASRAALLMDGVGAGFIHSRAGRVIEIVVGDHGRAPELIEYWLGEVGELFDRYSKPVEFAVGAKSQTKEETD